jgi:hypothetical protein
MEEQMPGLICDLACLCREHQFIKTQTKINLACHSGGAFPRHILWKESVE